MQRLIYSLLIVCMILSGCKVDLIDINTSTLIESPESMMTIDVRVSAEYISTKSLANGEECTVHDMDILIFSATPSGVILESIEMGLIPNRNEIVVGSLDKLVWSSNVKLPSSGVKKVLVIANASYVDYPNLKIGETTFEDISSKLSFSLPSQSEFSMPFVLCGQTTVANSKKAHIYVKLARQYNKVDVINSQPHRLIINKVRVLSAPSKAHIFLNKYDEDTAPPFIPYPEFIIEETDSKYVLKDKLYFLYTPSVTSEISPKIQFKGKIDGIDFDETIICEYPMYPDYNTEMVLSVSDKGRLVAEYTPDFNSWQTEGVANEITFASWLWTGLYKSNDYAQAWLAGNPVVSPEGASFKVVDIVNESYAKSITFTTGTSSQLKNRLRAGGMYTGDYFLWEIPINEAKKGGEIIMENAYVSATQWGPKYFLVEYSLDNVTWSPAISIKTEKPESEADRMVTYNIKLIKQDDPQPLDISIPINNTIRNKKIYVRLTVADSCCSKESNGDIDDSKTVGITYIHVKHYDSVDKDKVFDEDWSSIKFKYRESK